MSNQIQPQRQQIVLDDPHKRGYLARAMVQCTLPHSDPGALDIYERRDGNFILTVRGGYDPVKQCIVGIPYGPIAKLLLVWLTSEGIKSDDGVIILARTLGTFLKAIGLSRETGRGKRGDAKRVMEQLNRILRAEFGFYVVTGTVEIESKEKELKVTSERHLFWSKKDDCQTPLFDSYVVLNPEFLEEIKKNFVPVDLTIAGKLKKSPLALDLFFWMTYRLYRMQVGEDITVSWSDLASQFGADYKTEKDLRAAVRRTLAKITEQWAPAEKASDLSYRGLTLHGIPKNLLPIQEKQGELAFYRRKPTDPFQLSAAELLKAKDHAGGWDIFEMRKAWEKFCKNNSIVPDTPIAHFLGFLKEHRRRNGPGR